jgi:predicted heme/steroid binding protein/uncharacterized membrane protein
MKKEKITLTEIERYNGQNGGPVYIGYKGKVYDVTNSKLWSNGIHMHKHIAGCDLSSELEFAPHSEKVLESFPVIGELDTPEALKINSLDFYRRLYHLFHPHPVLVHYPIAGIIFAVLFIIFYMITGNNAFETGHFYLIILSFTGGSAATIFGIVSWWINYDFSLTHIFKSKLIYSCIFIIGELALIILRLYRPHILIEFNLLGIIYLCGLFALTGVVLFLAYLGGKLTFS